MVAGHARLFSRVKIAEVTVTYNPANCVFLRENKSAQGSLCSQNSSLKCQLRVPDIKRLLRSSKISTQASVARAVLVGHAVLSGESPPQRGRSIVVCREINNVI